MDEHTLNDLLECSVCLDRLNTSSKVLPCQHTFCRKCLEVIYASRQELRCPECRILVDTKIEDLPPNVLLMRILEGMKNAATKQQSQHNQQQQQQLNETNGKSETNRASSNTSIPTATTMTSDDRSRPPHQQVRQNNISQMQQQQAHHHQQFQQQHLPPIAQIPPQQMQQLQLQQLHQQQQQQQPTNPQQRRCIVPHAYALYDFESNEPTDLKFKKGDLILLRRKIDSNWYVGQFKGIEGNFPINYVQVVVPVPSSQCVALYDFKMGPNEEEGCLTFKKGTIIQVLRRVDQNWAEGRIGSSIGIFPIAFVELNHMAKQLLESFTLPTTSAQQNLTPQNATTQQTTEARDLPPIPVIDSATSNSAVDSTTTTSTSTAPIISTSCSSSSNSSATTSPTSTTTIPSTSSSTTTSSSSNTIFHSMPNSPQSSMPTTPQHSGQINNAGSSVRLRNNDLKHKRHSLNALLNNGGTALSIMQSTNRHSAEILSVPNDFEPELSLTSSTATGQTTAAREQQHHATNLPTGNSHTSLMQNQASTQSPSISSTPRHNVLKTCQQNVPSLPWGYLALYPYKPRKNDELELKKGCVYMVTERCLDGWFKGKNWKDVSGVFPGNYVTPLRARDQQQLMHSWKLIPPSNYPTISSMHMPNPATNQGVHQSIQPQLGMGGVVTSNYSSSMRNDLENINARLTLANLTPHQAMPPDLPPRQMAISSSATVNTPQHQPQNLTSRETRDKEALKEKPTTTGCISTSSSSSSSTSTSSASAGLKKFLTHIKARSKSPGTAIAAVAVAASTLATTQINAATAASQQHQQGQNGGKGVVNTLTPVHVRSGSCPSQLLQNFPNERIRPVTETKEEPTSKHQHPSPQTGYGSQRIKGPKERSSIENSRPTIDSTLRSIYANHIQQQSNLMPKKCGQQYNQQAMPSSSQQSSNTNFNIPNTATTTVMHRKSHSLDATNILQPSSLNNVGCGDALTSSLTTNGGGSVGPGVSLSGAALKPSAIHASATTNSQNNMAESRFRCVVPYPPNSDVELELQVGDIIFVYRKQKNGWYKGTNSRTYKTGLFPASFVEPDL